MSYYILFFYIYEYSVCCEKLIPVFYRLFYCTFLLCSPCNHHKLNAENFRRYLLVYLNGSAGIS